MKAKIPTPICGQCVHFKMISKSSGDDTVLLDLNPMGQCTKEETCSVVLKAYKSSTCEQYEQYKPFYILGGFVYANS